MTIPGGILNIGNPGPGELLDLLVKKPGNLTEELVFFQKAFVCFGQENLTILIQVSREQGTNNQVLCWLTFFCRVSSMAATCRVSKS